MLGTASASAPKVRCTLLPLVLALATTTVTEVNAETAPQRSTRSTSASSLDSQADAEARRAIQQRLASDRLLRGAGLEVSVAAGIVVLSGAVPVWPWSTRAARIARVMQGVRAVVNRTRFVPVRRPDALVRREIRQALRANPALAKLPISVVVRRGVVQLSGSITSWDEQQLAERVATSVAGVRFCQNQLTLARAIQRSAPLFAADVQSRLGWDPYVDRSPIRVSAQGSRVVLAGTVASAAQRKRAIMHAWVPGVTAVDASGLLVEHALPGEESLRRTWPSDAQISATIAELAPYWPRLAISGVSITVVGGVVTLRGNVPALADRDAAEDMARSAVGVVDVQNELRGPWWRAPVRPPPVKAAPPARRKPRKKTR